MPSNPTQQNPWQGSVPGSMGTKKGYLAGDAVGVIYLGLKVEVGVHRVTRKEKASKQMEKHVGRWEARSGRGGEVSLAGQAGVGETSQG